MSQPNKRGRSTQLSNDEDYDGPSQSKKRNMPAPVNSEEVERKVKDLVRYALACEQKKVLIRRDEIRKKILQDYGRQYTAVFGRAQGMLADIFGMKMCEVQPRESTQTSKSKPSTTTAQGSTQTKASLPVSYTLCNVLASEFDVSQVIHESDDEYVCLGVLYLSLALIFVNESMLTEGDLKRYLDKVKLTTTGMDHDELDSTLNTFVKQGYLHRQKQNEAVVDAGAEPQFEYRWGPRATAEIQTDSIIKFIASFYDEGIEELRVNIMKAAGVAD
ncbi:MAGE family-domain-containing protein [Gongronella butleri]|nr:MAGE family-domain-containing protein [Gongronella butleri]